MKRIIVLYSDERPVALGMEEKLYQKALRNRRRKYKPGNKLIMNVQLEDIVKRPCKEKCMVNVERANEQYILIKVPKLEIK